MQQSVGTENAENVTISNSGTISSVENRSIYFYDGATGTTLTNNSSGVILIHPTLQLFNSIRALL